MAKLTSKFVFEYPCDPRSIFIIPKLNNNDL